MEEKIKFIADWTKPKDDLLHTEAFSKIINFYLFSTPCNETSSSGLSMKKRGWGDKPWQSGDLRSCLLHDAGLSVGINYSKANTAKDVLSKASEIGLTKGFYKLVTDNRIAFYGSGKCAEFLDIFFYIRCAFAHGRFKLKTLDNDEVIYYMEALERKNSNCFILKARMAIMENTLLEWINIITGGDKEFTARKASFEKDIQDRIIQLVNESYGGASKQIILNEIDAEDRLIIKQIEKLKNSKMLIYDRHKRAWVSKN